MSNVVHSPQVQREAMVSQGYRHRTGIAVVAAFAASCMLTAWWGEDSVPSYRGVLEAHVTRVEAPSDGQLVKWIIDEGMLVRAGDPLLILEDPQRLEHRKSLTIELAEARSQLAQAIARADVELSWRVENLDSQILRARIDSAGYLKEQFNYDLRNRAYDTWHEEPGFLRLPTAEPVIEPLVYRTREPSAERMQALLRSEELVNAREVVSVQIEMYDRRIAHLETLKAELPETVHRANGVERLETEVARIQSRLDEIAGQEPRVELIATGYGTASMAHLAEMSAVHRGDLLLELVDEHQLAVVVEVPSSAAPCFSTGTVVTLGFPGHEIRQGTVHAVSRRAYALDGDSSTGEEPVIELRVAPHGQLWPAVPTGSSVEVSLAGVGE